MKRKYFKEIRIGSILQVGASLGFIETELE